MKSLESKVAVVTGGASGIGLALARAFLGRGMSVVVADIEEAALDAACVELSERAHDGREVVGVPTDVSSLDSVQELADVALARLGRVDVVCNNAGVESGGSFLNISDAAWRWVMDVNFFGVLNGCRVFLPLLEQQEEGHVVNTASIASFLSGSPYMTPYCASKMAVDGLSEGLEAELRSTGSSVGISLLAPGPTRTRMVDAERNRPDAVPGNDEVERVAAMEALRERLEADGQSPDHVAELTVDAILLNRFFVLPRPDLALAGMHRRMAWMETGETPPPRTAGA